jgi:UDP-N-acetylglucosamine--N-acetylmuramyl-(pentapeptide) pyrophosphoryl-undecaprenol N-acetylglucosamine transferase
VLILAGGTGGHVFPGLAVAAQLRSLGCEVIWLGVRRGVEASVVPRCGIEIHFVRVGGLRRRGWLGWLLAPVRVGLATIECIRLIRRLRPDAVLGMGGFVSGPAGVAAWLLRRPLLVHEQNSIPGLTNRVLAPLANRVMEAFPGSFPARVKPLYTGNPVREEIARIPAPAARMTERTGRLRLLVLGGSQGARTLNEVVPAALAALPDPSLVEVRHQAGEKNLSSARASYTASHLDVQPVAFIDDMGGAYGWADLVVCRAGATTVAELAVAGAASVLVPFPFAVDDHQTKNARRLVESGAAVLVPEGEFNAGRLSRLLEEFLHARDRLLRMAEAARAIAVPDAAQRVARHCLEAAHG